MKDYFDAKYYAQENPDVVQVIGNNANRLYQHFLKYGIKEGRSLNAFFNPKEYRENYKDLNAAFGDNMSAYLDHYIKYGFKEKRDSGGEVNLAEYVEAYSDVSTALGTDIKKIYEHYENAGKKEGRTAGTVAAKEAAKKAAEAAAKKAASTASTTTTSSTQTPTPPAPSIYPLGSLESNFNSKGVTGIANGTSLEVIATRLPSSVNMICATGAYIGKANINWNVAAITADVYNPSKTNLQQFTVEGTVVLPSNVHQPNSPVSLTTSISVRVEAEEGVVSLGSVEEPSLVTKSCGYNLTTNDLESITFNTNKTAAVDWDIKGCGYDPSIQTEQNLTIHGRLILPEGITATPEQMNITCAVKIEASTFLSYSSINTGAGAAIASSFDVSYDTSASAALATLPSTAYAKSNTGKYYPVNISWNWSPSATYAATTPGNYDVVGTVTSSSAPAEWTLETISSKIAVSAAPTLVGYFADTSASSLVVTKSVAYDTAEETAVAELPTTAYAKDTDGHYYQVDISWSCLTYSATTPGDYDASGTVSAHEGVNIPATIDITNALTEGCKITVRAAEAH